MNSIVKKLARQIDNARGSDDLLDIIKCLAAARVPDAVPVLASLLDSPGSVGRSAARALRKFPREIVEPEMRRCLEALDEDMIRNAHRVLGAFGDGRSRRAARTSQCWADFDKSEAARANAAQVKARTTRRRAA